MTGSARSGALRDLVRELDRMQSMSEPDRVAELERLEAVHPPRARRLRRLLERQRAATAFFDALEQALGRGLAAELDAAWAPGRVVGPYRLDRLLATGGMDAVFLARKADGELKRPVALKLVPPGLVTGEATERMRRERDLLAALAHPNIAPLIDAGITEDGQPWFAMEYIEGERFDRWVETHCADPRACIERLRILTEAVAFAHANLVVHGDLKPGNVLVDRHGRIRLLDFGIARMLDELPGGAAPRYLTERYAAPEVRAGRRPRPASDVFSLGRMLEEVIDAAAPSGRRARRELRAIAARAVAASPDERYSGAQALADDLRRWLDGEPVDAWGGGAVYRASKRVVRYPWASAGTAAAGALLVVFAVVSTLQAQRFERERDSARQLAEFLEQVFVSADPHRAPDDSRGSLTARELLDRGRAGLAEEGFDPQVRARFESILGRTYQRLGDYATAGELIDRALARLPAGDAQRPDLLIERAETHRLAGEFDAAERAYRALLEAVSPDEPARRGRALSGLGRTLAQAGRPAEAVGLLEDGLALTRRAPGVGIEMLADRLNDLGSALFRLGRYDEAITYLEEALPLRRQADLASGFDRGSPRTATLINNLALMHYLQGRPDEAEPRFRQALALRRALLPDGHPDLAQTMTNLGLMLKDYGDANEAVVLLDEALLVRRAGLEPGHYRIAQAMLNLGIAVHQSGNLERADGLLGDALRRLEATLGVDHAQVAVAHNEIGRLRLAEGRPTEAESAHRRALAIQREALSEGHPHLAWSLLGLGRALAAAGRFDAARSALAEAVSIRRATLPERDPLRLEAERALAELDAVVSAKIGVRHER